LCRHQMSLMQAICIEKRSDPESLLRRKQSRSDLPDRRHCWRMSRSAPEGDRTEREGRALANKTLLRAQSLPCKLHNVRLSLITNTHFQ
jgi:hypothetical protein